MYDPLPMLKLNFVGAGIYLFFFHVFDKNLCYGFYIIMVFDIVVMLHSP